MSTNQLKHKVQVQRTILYPKRIVVIIQHALRLPFHDALVMERRIVKGGGTVSNNYALKASR
jgi:hypothetical protein